MGPGTGGPCSLHARELARWGTGGRGGWADQGSGHRASWKYTWIKRKGSDSRGAASNVRQEGLETMPDAEGNGLRDVEQRCYFANIHLLSSLVTLAFGIQNINVT